MDYWSVLGLPADADIRTIKREYARQLKVTRPDDNPVGFQRLRDAYEAALTAAQRREERAESPAPLPPISEPVQAIAPVQVAAPSGSSPTPVPIPATPAIIERVPSAKSGHERAQQLLDHLTIANVDERLSLARAWGCTDIFEEQLLFKLAAENDTQLLEWSLTSFRWLSAWQRQNLSVVALGRVLLHIQQATEQGLRRYLDAGDVEAFERERLRLTNNDWLQPLERREWLAHTLARVLLQSPFWSEDLIDSLNATYGWDRNDLTIPAMALWPALAARSKEHYAERRMNEMRASTDRHVAKAARLLFGDWTQAQRRSLSRNFSGADWSACEKMANDIQAYYPTLRKHVSSGDLFFWQALRNCRADWPLLGALAAATLYVILQNYWNEGASFTETSLAFLKWLAVVESGGWLLLWLCNHGISRFATRRWFTRPLTSGPKLADWPLSRLSEGLPATLAGAATLIVDPATLFVYVSTMAALTAVRWKLPQLVKKVGWLIGQMADRPKVTFSIAGTLFVLTVLLGGPERLDRYQGLQSWAPRVCLADEAIRPCRVPPTQEQWYPTGQAR